MDLYRCEICGCLVESIYRVQFFGEDRTWELCYDCKSDFESSVGKKDDNCLVKNNVKIEFEDSKEDEKIKVEQGVVSCDMMEE